MAAKSPPEDGVLDLFSLVGTVPAVLTAISIRAETKGESEIDWPACKIREIELAPRGDLENVEMENHTGARECRGSHHSP